MFFVDDGFSGTNFDRPDWQRLMTLVDEGKVGMLMLWRLTPRVGRLWSVAEAAEGTRPRTPRATRHPLKPRMNRRRSTF